jgi:8-oxo-dGTP diphosphatase
MTEPIDDHRVRLAADICVLRSMDGNQQILLIRRGNPPFKGSWALPGGRLEANETLDQCAIRELLEETDLNPTSIDHFANFSDPQRDPRERTVSAAYIAWVASDACPRAGSDAAQIRWFSTSALPPLAFDHDLIIQTCISVLRHSAASSD